MGIDEARPARHVLHLAAVQGVLVEPVEAGDIGLPAHAQRAPVATSGLHGEAVLGGIPQLVREISGVPQHLLGDAAGVDAGAAKPVGLDQQYARAVFRCPLSAGKAAAAAADHDQVILGRLHELVNTLV